MGAAEWSGYSSSNQSTAVAPFHHHHSGSGYHHHHHIHHQGYNFDPIAANAIEHPSGSYPSGKTKSNQFNCKSFANSSSLFYNPQFITTISPRTVLQRTTTPRPPHWLLYWLRQRPTLQSSTTRPIAPLWSQAVPIQHRLAVIWQEKERLVLNWTYLILCHHHCLTRDPMGTRPTVNSCLPQITTVGLQHPGIIPCSIPVVDRMCLPCQDNTPSRPQW